jgi:hypothetical protein
MPPQLSKLIQMFRMGIWSWQLVDCDNLKAAAVVIVCLACTGTCDG